MELAQAETAKKEEIQRHANVDLIWNDVTIHSEKLSQLKSFQKVNHFPSMNGVTKKNNLAASLKKMKNHYPIDYGFYPKTWVIPHQMTKLKSDMAKEKASKGKKTMFLPVSTTFCIHNRADDFPDIFISREMGIPKLAQNFPGIPGNHKFTL